MHRRRAIAIGMTLAACGGSPSAPGPDGTDAGATTGAATGSTSTTVTTSTTSGAVTSDATADDRGDTTSASAAASTSDDTTAGSTDCAGFDPNGVQQIYCTEPSGAPPWTLGFDDWEIRTRQFGDVSGTEAQTIAQASGQVRMTVKAEDSDCEGLDDHGQALAQGYMCSPLDWRNYEMTGYFQLVDAAPDSSDQDWTMYGNGGRHTGDGPPVGCLGSSYKGSYHYVDAQVRVAKESWHVNYHYRDGWQDVRGGIDYSQDPDRWLGMKVIRYELERDGSIGVRNEVWLDLDGIDDAGAPSNAWQLVTVSEDHASQPSWGDAATECGAPVDDQIMLWGGPWVTWRWDGTTSRLRLMSVREIVPPDDVPPP